MIEKPGGRVAYIVAAFAAYGNLGSDSFILPWSQVRYGTPRGGYCSDLTERQLAPIPAHARGEQLDLPTPEEEDELHAYFRVPATAYSKSNALLKVRFTGREWLQGVGGRRSPESAEGLHSVGDHQVRRSMAPASAAPRFPVLEWLP